jgi:hypothetical protein
MKIQEEHFYSSGMRTQTTVGNHGSPNSTQRTARSPKGCKTRHTGKGLRPEGQPWELLQPLPAMHLGAGARAWGGSDNPAWTLPQHPGLARGDGMSGKQRRRVPTGWEQKLLCHLWTLVSPTMYPRLSMPQSQPLQSEDDKGSNPHASLHMASTQSTLTLLSVIKATS